MTAATSNSPHALALATCRSMKSGKVKHFEVKQFLTLSSLVLYKKAKVVSQVPDSFFSIHLHLGRAVFDSGQGLPECWTLFIALVEKVPNHLSRHPTHGRVVRRTRPYRWNLPETPEPPLIAFVLLSCLFILVIGKCIGRILRAIPNIKYTL